MNYKWKLILKVNIQNNKFYFYLYLGCVLSWESKVLWLLGMLQGYASIRKGKWNSANIGMYVKMQNTCYNYPLYDFVKSWWGLNWSIKLRKQHNKHTRVTTNQRKNSIVIRNITLSMAWIILRRDSFLHFSQ